MENKRFDELNISPEILRALTNRGFINATPVQSEAIPPLMEWHDIVAKAPTGTGKTFAFGIPIIEHIDIEDESVQALILAPTRELAIQIGSELSFLLEYKKDIHVAVLYGGQQIDTQIKAVKRKPQIIVATPGRMMDHYKRKILKLSNVKTVVIDEADRMFDMGFIDDVTRIIELMPARRNLALLSATISVDVMTISWKYQRDEVEITVPANEENRPDITQYSIEAVGSQKPEAVIRIMEGEGFDKAIIFCNTKSMVRRLEEELERRGKSVGSIHGDIKQSLREKAMSQFRKGDFEILIATDVVGRGIDVDDVACVINYDVPDENEYYLHRIGRTGRAKKRGVAYTLISTINDSVKLSEIAKYSNAAIAPMRFTAEGALESAPPKKAAPKRSR